MTVETKKGIVGEMVENLLPKVNKHIDWEYIRSRYDENPEWTAVSIHFVESMDDDEPAETLVLGVADGPEVVLIDTLGPDWDHIGSVVTYQNYGTRILDPDDSMTPYDARYQHRGVNIIPAEGESQTRVWMVAAEIMNMVVDTLEHAKRTAESAED